MAPLTVLPALIEQLNSLWAGQMRPAPRGVYEGLLYLLKSLVCEPALVLAKLYGEAISPYLVHSNDMSALVTPNEALNKGR